MKQPIWLLLDAVYAMHKAQIAEHGGSDGVRDKGLLQSALARPENLYAYGENVDLAALGASYAFGIAKNHPFVDGNKRTALVAVRTFLAQNGAEFKATAEDKYVMILKLAEGSLDEGALCEWVRKCIA